jgi:probable HAF family extracellular repeat protein
MQDLGDILGLERYSYGANGINASGVVVGTLAVGATLRAFKYQDGVMTTLGGLTLSGTGSALGINASGQIVGSSDAIEPNNVVPHAFLYMDGAMRDLGVAGSANAINDAGVIVGGMYVQNGSLMHAFVRIDGVIQDLGTLYSGSSTAKSSANAINSSGQIVGNSQTLAGGLLTTHAFLHSDGAMLDLNNLLEGAPGWTLKSASGINDAGQIVGLGSIDGVTHGYLLTPVPEPSGLVLAGLGLIWLLSASRHRVCGQLARHPPVVFFSRR